MAEDTRSEEQIRFEKGNADASEANAKKLQFEAARAALEFKETQKRIVNQEQARKDKNNLQGTELIAPLIGTDPVLTLRFIALQEELKSDELTPEERLNKIELFYTNNTEALQTDEVKRGLRLNVARGISINFDANNDIPRGGPVLSELIQEDPENEQLIRSAAINGMVQDLKFKNKAEADSTIDAMLGANKIDQDTANRVRNSMREEARREADALIERFTSGVIELKQLEEEAKRLGYEEGTEVYTLIQASLGEFKDIKKRFGNIGEVAASGQAAAITKGKAYDLFFGRDQTPEELAKMTDKQRAERANIREEAINKIIEKTLEGLPEPAKSIQREKLLNQSKLNEANRIAVAAEGIALKKEAEAKDFNANWRKLGLLSKYFGPAILGIGIGAVIGLGGNIEGAAKLLPLLIGGAAVPGAIGGGKYFFGGGLKEWRNINAEKARAIAGLTSVEPKVLAMQGNLAASQEATLGSIAEMAVQAQIAKTGRMVDKRAYDQMLRRAYGLIGYSPESAGRSTKGLFQVALA